VPSRRADCVNVFPCLKTVTQVSSVMNDPDATSSTDENIERVLAVILNNRRVTTNEGAHYMHISHGHFHGIIHKGLGFHSVSARWVPNSSQDKKSALFYIQPKRIGSPSPRTGGSLRRIVNGDDT